MKSPIDKDLYWLFLLKGRVTNQTEEDVIHLGMHGNSPPLPIYFS
jgi:hypothetical protein